jgi:hypothetical protein
MFLLDDQGNIISRDIPKVLGTIKCGPDLKGQRLPEKYNEAVMKVKRLFVEEVKFRQAQKDHTVSLSHGQRYALKELRIYFGTVEDEDTKANINLLERAFRLTGMTRAVRDELNKLRRNNITGESLFKSLVRVYQQHNLREWLDRPRNDVETLVPRIVCSEWMG